MNGAAEIILEELLKEAKKTNKALADMLKANAKVSSSPESNTSASGAASGLSAVASAAGPLGLLLKGINGVFNGLGVVLGKMFEVVGKVVGGLLQTSANLFDFAQKAALSGAKLSEFYDAFRNLPFFLGEVMGIFAKIIGFSEGLLKSYQDLTKVGASFSGNLFTMLKAATDAGMTLNEFQGVVKNNSDIFSTMGGNVNDGIMKFSEYSKNLMGPGSKYSKQLLALGYTSEEAGEALAGYIRSQGTMNKEGLANADAVSESVIAYANQLDSLSKMTGKHRDQIEKGVKDAEKEANLQTFLAGLSKENADTARAALADAFAKGGPVFRDQIALGMQGVFGPVTKEMGDLAAGTGGESVVAARRVYEIMNSNLSSSQKSAQIIEANNGAMEGALRTARAAGTQNSAIMAATNNGMFQSIATFRQTGLSMTNAGAALAKAEQQRAEQLKGNAGSLAQAEQNIKLFGTTIMGIIGSALQPLMLPLTNFGMEVTKLITVLIDSKGFKGAIASVTDWFTKTLGELGKAKSPTEFFTKFFDQIVSGMEGVWKAVSPTLEKLWARLEPKMAKIFEDVFNFLKPYWDKLMKTISDAVSDYIADKTGIGEQSKDRKEREKTQESKNYKDWFEKLQKSNDVFGQFGSYNRNLAKSDDKDAYAIYKDQIDKGQWKGGQQELGDAYAKELAQRASITAIHKDRPRGGRDFGTSGMLGKNAEPENTTVDIEKGERVLNPAETAGYNNQAQAFDQLNNLTKQLLDAMRENNDLTRRGVDATKGLSGNLFA